MKIVEKRKDSFLVSTDPSCLNLDLVHQFLAESYWAMNIPRDLFEKSVKNSLNFGVYENGAQVGFARVVSDYSTFAYLADVFILPSYRGKGLSRLLMDTVMEHLELQGLRRFCLGTRDAHGLYEKYGFKLVAQPQNLMEIKVSGIYLKNGK